MQKRVSPNAFIATALTARGLHSYGDDIHAPERECLTDICGSDWACLWTMPRRPGWRRPAHSLWPRLRAERPSFAWKKRQLFPLALAAGPTIIRATTAPNRYDAGPGMMGGYGGMGPGIDGWLWPLI